MALRSISALALAACTAAPTLAPIIDTPAAGTAGDPWPDVATLTMQAAHAGAAGGLREASFTQGQTPELPDVPFADDLVVHLTGTRADGVELAYGRTCPVAVRADATPAAPHLYFARIVRWAAGPRPAAPARTGGAAYATPDGSAVFVGGDGGESVVDRFADGGFAAPGFTSAPRQQSVVAPLPDGSALRIGGAVDGVPVGFFELLPAPDRAGPMVERVDDARVALTGHAAATLVDGSVVVAGGRDASDTATGATWTFRLGDAGAPAPPELMASALATARAGHTMTRLGDEVGAAVLVVGGQDAAGAPVAAAELWEPLRESYAAFHPAMVRPRYDHRAIRLPDGSVLVVGGRDGAGPVASIEVYQPRIGQFTKAATLPPGAGLTELTVTALPDGRVLLAGGRDAGGAAVATTLIARLDPLDGTVDLTPTDALAVARAGHAATLLCDGTVLLAGGTADASAPGSERYNPPAAGRR